MSDINNINFSQENDAKYCKMLTLMNIDNSELLVLKSYTSTYEFHLCILVVQNSHTFCFQIVS